MLIVRLYELQTDDGKPIDELNIGLGATFSRDHAEDVRDGLVGLLPEGSTVSELFERDFTDVETPDSTIVPQDSRSRFHMNIRPHIEVERDPYVLEILAKIAARHGTGHELAVFDHRISGLGKLLFHTSDLGDDAVKAHGLRGRNWER